MTRDDSSDVLLPYDLAEHVRERCQEHEGAVRNLDRRAAWDAGMIQLALREIQTAKASLHRLGRCASLPITRSLGEESEAMQSICIAEQQIARVLAAMRRLQDPDGSDQRLDAGPQRLNTVTG
ncbi:hypothetical protein [Vineibacter terrae]|uniref:hypothetical protein n=1 Tax=Vineibacter terrae TaxID=2586908 RepID=UPI002E2F202F|nr:hypothetical protein [Vineibacter terrae]HEX2891860.1 hypothetical protein [Vineibacter terrae]